MRVVRSTTYTPLTHVIVFDGYIPASKRDFRGEMWRCKGGFVYLRGKVAVAAERNKNPIKMRKKWNADLVVDMVKYELNKMGLGHFETKHLLDGESGKEPHIMVTMNPNDRQFGYVIEALDRYFSIDMLVDRFKCRQNYYKLTQEERDEIFAQRIHPEAWEQDFLKANA